MRTLLLGGRSQLGHDLLRVWPEGSVTALGHEQCDVTDPAAVRSAIAAAQADLVINLAASHRVDDLEADATPGFQVNAFGAWTVARLAAEAGAAVLWVSTDYVFAGDRDQPYREDDPVGPLSNYGASKAAGERLVAAANPRHYVVRSSGLYGVAGASGKGGNFVETMLRLARDGRPLRVVADQLSAPTSTADLAAALWALVQTEAYGVIHLTNQGALTWHDFAALIFRLCGVAADLTPTTSAAYGAAARRPAYSVLANEQAAALGLPPLPPVEQALAAYLRAKGHLGQLAHR